MNFLQTYKNAVSEVLDDAYLCSSETDPELTNRLIITVRAYFVLCCYVSKKVNRQLSLAECITWINHNLADDTPFQYLFERTEEQVNDIVDRHLKQIDEEVMSSDTGELYESLLQTDVSEKAMRYGDSSRKKQGSYYSPKELRF